MILDNAFLDRMRFQGDTAADQIINEIFTHDQQPLLFKLIGGGKETALQEPENPVSRFLLEDPIVPDWFDEQRLRAGQAVFRKFALECMTLLGALSLPYCYAASPGNKAIYITGKMQHSTGKRLLQTADFIIAVLERNSFDEDGNGMFEIQRTRLIHAMVRHYVQSKSKWNPGWGIPVNQEDMAGTNLAFSYIVLKGLEKLNFVISQQEKEDFLYAWRFIGYQLRISEALLPENYAEAALLEARIKERHFRLSDEAKFLTSELLNHYRRSFPAAAALLIESQIRYFVGPEVSVLLGLKRQPVRDLFIGGLNKIQGSVNKRFVNPSSYETMIRNHQQLRRRYQ